jgi:hypothetical protein
LEASERLFAKGLSINLDGVLQFIKAVVEFNVQSLEFGYDEPLQSAQPVKLYMKTSSKKASPLSYTPHKCRS